MEKEKLAILESDIKSQITEIDKIFKLIDERAKGTTRAELEGLSFWLHNLYCAFEDIFKIIAKAFENNIDDPSQFHINLLKRMNTEIKGTRPALISNEIFPSFDNLRAFRHLIRHAYMYELDERKVKLVLEDALKIKKTYKKEFQSFIDKF